MVRIFLKILKLHHLLFWLFVKRAVCLLGWLRLVLLLGINRNVFLVVLLILDRLLNLPILNIPIHHSKWILLIPFLTKILPLHLLHPRISYILLKGLALQDLRFLNLLHVWYMWYLLLLGLVVATKGIETLNLGFDV